MIHAPARAHPKVSKNMPPTSDDGTADAVEIICSNLNHCKMTAAVNGKNSGPLTKMSTATRSTPSESDASSREADAPLVQTFLV